MILRLIIINVLLDELMNIPTPTLRIALGFPSNPSSPSVWQCPSSSSGTRPNFQPAAVTFPDPNRPWLREKITGTGRRQIDPSPLRSHPADYLTETHVTPIMKRLRHCLLVLLAGFALPLPAPAQAALTTTEPVLQLPTFRVEAEAEKDHYIQGPFLPATQGTKINAGKKTTVLDFDSLPRITGNNYRQALSQAPGLILSEETSPLISIGYRGLAPHRAQFTQVLKDGVPLHADQLGYPEAYYAPPLDTVDRIEFTRGGAALMYGPQPGGALNYVTHRPRTDTKLGGSTLHTFGSDGYYSTFSYLDGTTGPLGYYGYYNHRESDGIRTANSDYELDAFSGRLVLGADTSSRWILTAESYEEEHGEPGGLTFATGTGAVNYRAQRAAPSRLYDRFNLDRQALSLVWERDYSRGTFVGRVWAIDYTRASRRQGGGGFGTLPTGASAGTNTIERQHFDQRGAEARVRLDWGGNGGHVFTAGAQLYHTGSPRTDSRGSTADATTVVNADLEEGRAVQYELGYRAQPVRGLVLDASVFYLEFDNQIGGTTLPNGLTSVANIGRAVHQGAELSVSYDLLARGTAPASGGVRPALNLYVNTLLLDAEFKEGSTRGKTPQYAPAHVVRAGMFYSRGDALKLAFTGTLSADSYADDGNTAQRYVPAYAVWDLTAEWRVPHTPLRLIGGVNNAFDEDYYSRVRPDGIDPAPRRNFYIGAALEF